MLNVNYSLCVLSLCSFAVLCSCFVSQFGHFESLSGIFCRTNSLSLFPLVGFNVVCCQSFLWTHRMAWFFSKARHSNQLNQWIEVKSVSFQLLNYHNSIMINTVCEWLCRAEQGGEGWAERSTFFNVELHIAVLMAPFCIINTFTFVPEYILLSILLYLKDFLFRWSMFYTALLKDLNCFYNTGPM